MKIIVSGCVLPIDNIRDVLLSDVNISVVGLWAVVNSATWAPFGEVEWIPFTVYRQAAEVNLFAVIRICQVFLPLVRKTKGWFDLVH